MPGLAGTGLSGGDTADTLYYGTFLHSPYN